MITTCRNWLIFLAKLYTAHQISNSRLRHVFIVQQTCGVPLFSALYPTLNPFHHRTERSFPLRTLSGRCQDQPLFAFAIEVFVAIVGRFHKTIDVATVKSTTNKLVADDSAFLRLLHQGVSDLNFPITTGRC